MGWLFSLLTLLSGLAQAKDVCPTLLTTSFGIRGPLIATLEPQGQLTVIRDGFEQTGVWGDGPGKDGKIPRFEREDTRLGLHFRPATAMSAMRFPHGNGDFFAVVSEAGVLSLVLPDNRTLSLQWGGVARAVALYRQPVRKVQEGLIPIDGIRTPQHRTTRSTPREQLDELTHNAECYQPMALYFSDGRAVFKTTVVMKSLEGQPQRLLDTVRTGITEAYEGVGDTFGRWEKIDLHWIDMDRVAAGAHILIPTIDPNIAVDISGFGKVYEFEDEKEMASVDYIQALSPNVLAVGSELGQVAILDYRQSKVRPLAFPTAVWMQSLAAHRTQDGLEVWAVTSTSQLYQWKSGQTLDFFKRDERFPESVAPQRVATFAAPLPFGYETSLEHGYLSNFRVGKKGVDIQQTVVLGDDGKIYGLRDSGTSLEVEKPQAWVTGE